jgi:predicted acyltransferase
MAAARLRSLDAFRGLTMAAMVIVNNPGDWDHVYPPLLHAAWHGWTPTDLIFPFFLFIVGVSLAMGEPNRRSWSSVLRRTGLLFALGLFLAGFPLFRPDTWRIPGVLQRIAICYFASIAVFALTAASETTRHRRRLAVVIGVLLGGYWLALTFVPVPDGAAGDLSDTGNLGAWLDRTLLGGHLWRPGWDPEGLLSTVPAIATTLAGVVSGSWLREQTSPRKVVTGLATWGLAGVLAGLAWHAVFPINKNLWTSSYVLFTAGVGAAGLAACYWWTDVDAGPWRVRLSEPFVALGRNAILLFVLSGLIARTLMYVRWPDPSLLLGRWIYQAAFAPIAQARNASLLYALAHLAVLWMLLWWLHRRRAYLTV